MIYNYHYDIAALMLIVLLISIYFLRRNYPTTANKAFLAILFFTFTATVSDLLSALTIPKADEIPLLINYLINIIYLISYNSTAIVFYIYVTIITKQYHKRYTRISAYIAFCVNSFILLPTPWTHWGIYFDENFQYQHGVLFPLLYVSSFLMLLSTIYFFFRYRYNLSRYQVVSVLFFIIAMISAVVFQMFFPAQLVGCLVSTLFTVLVYISLQNPEYYINSRNRCYNEHALNETLQHNIRHEKSFSLLAFSLDGFQYVNQLLGTDAGNHLIDSFVPVLHSKYGINNVYQLSDGRFAIMLPDKNEKPVTRELLQFFQTPHTVQNVNVLLTPHICVVHYPDFAHTPEDIFNTIDYTLKYSLASNTEKHITASKDELKKSTRETQILHAMKNAIHNQGFQVYYQPIFNAKTKKFSSAEALVRLYDPELGFIPPDEFIPMSERNGMIIDIGEQVFRQVCQFIQSHDLKELGLDYIEANLSFVQCIQNDLSQRLTEIMKEYDVLPQQINFEITETAGSTKANALQKNMDGLIRIGSTFAMDDYGTGFSTANYLVNLPLDFVKIDKSILWSAMADEQAFTILKHTVEMLHALNKKIIVEGVETEEMVDMLTDMNCEYLQGYLYSKPINSEEFVIFLQNYIA